MTAMAGSYFDGARKKTPRSVKYVEVGDILKTPTPIKRSEGGSISTAGETILKLVIERKERGIRGESERKRKEERKGKRKKRERK